MKPEKLVLCGWGPYKDSVEVDFTGMDRLGIFLVTGPTGAGKTTLFDAVTYALYGCMSGETREKNSVRSDFAGEDTPTFVELTMRHGDREYRITRSPEYRRLKKRQGGKGGYTKEKERAVLYLPDGRTVEGGNEVNRALREILVLDCRQFKQISMIAQGEFARLLAASPAEKTRIFREIFDTSVYDRFAGVLKSRAAERYQEVMELRHRMEEDIHMLRAAEESEAPGERAEEYGKLSALIGKEGADYGEIVPCLAKIISMSAGPLAAAEKKYASCEKEVTALTGELAAAQQINTKLCQLKEEKEKYELIEAERKETGNKEKELKRAREASGMEGDYIRCENIGRRLEETAEKQELVKKETESLRAERDELRIIYEKRETVEEAYGHLAFLEEQRKLSLRLEEEIGKKRDELCKLQEAYVTQEKKTAESRQAYEAADRAVKRAAVGIAAQLLKEGEPCPVCGSREHPHIASVKESAPDEEGLRRLQEDFEKKSASLSAIHGQAFACKGELREKEERLNETRKLQKDREESLRAMDRETVELSRSMSGEEYRKKLFLYGDLTARIEEKEGLLQSEKEEGSRYRKSLREASEAFEIRYREAGFSSLHAFKESLRSVEQMNALEEIVRSFYDRVLSCEQRILHLTRETKGKKETDMDSLKEQLSESAKKRKEALKKRNEEDYRMKELKKIHGSLKEKQKRLLKAEKEYGVIRDLSGLASGNNQRRLVFEQYVLAGYFEEILKAANIRLLGMTGGRYELSRAEEVSDGRTKDSLEIRVMDYYTGKYRSVKTLSGGESFKASLALALGMSDVIQSYSGGIRVETLFIDEGFGSLDSESLEQACGTLLSLTEKDRLIGIISHVPELSEKIENQIIIEKTSVGSRVKVVVC